MSNVSASSHNRRSDHSCSSSHSSSKSSGRSTFWRGVTCLLLSSVSIIASVSLQHTTTTTLTSPPDALAALLTVYATFSLYSLASMLQRISREGGETSSEYIYIYTDTNGCTSYILPIVLIFQYLKHDSLKYLCNTSVTWVNLLFVNIYLAYVSSCSYY